MSATTEFVFHFRRGHGFDVWAWNGHGGRNLSAYGVSPYHPTKAAAVEWAREYARKRLGCEFRERVKPPPPTPEEERRRWLNGQFSRVRSAEVSARECEGRDEWRKAAEHWLRSVRYLEELMEKHPRHARHYARCAETRLAAAAEALRSHAAHLLNVKPRFEVLAGGAA